LQRVLGAAETRERFRQAETHFTRERVLSFESVAVLILRGHKLSLQNALNKFFGALGEVFQVPTTSAYCQARQKIQPELFRHLNEVVRQDFYALYGGDGQVKLWHGPRVLGADGTYVNLPDTPETRASFSVQSNQRAESERVQAWASVLYDLRNDLGLDATLGAKQAEKKALFESHWAATQPGDVLVLDRNYADYSVMAWAVKGGREVVIRFPRNRFTVVNPFWAADTQEQLVTLSVPPKARRFVKEHHLPRQVQLRLIKVVLGSGEIEVVGTTLLDQSRYPHTEFKEVYGWRWGEETYFDRIKNIFELERFSGSTLTAINQDFYGVIFLASLESVLTRPAQAALSTLSQQRGCQTVAQVNRAVSYVALVDRVVELLADPRRSPEAVWAELHHLFQTNPTRQRAGRKVDRPKLTHARRLWFQRYIKRIIA
jgi:Transposase DDE domain